MALTEKKTREWWTIYEKWAVVEALLGSGMSITEYCRDRAQYRQTPEMTHRLYIKNSLY